MKPGEKFRLAVTCHQPLQIVGVINPYVATMAERIGYRALYLSGAGVANSSYALPDLGMTTLDNVLLDASRIISATELPLLVDIDTGWGSELMIERTIKEMIRVGVAAIHIEDQEGVKRCGHRPGKKIVSTEEMCDRISACSSARGEDLFVIMARTDALANEGIDRAIERSLAYIEAGADMLFPEAFTTLEQYKQYREAVKVPILANITEFGKTPLFTLDELSNAQVDMALYPLSANRAMNQAAFETLTTIMVEGSQKSVLEKMQTREELYEFLNYHTYEQRITGKRDDNDKR